MLSVVIVLVSSHVTGSSHDVFALFAALRLLLHVFQTLPPELPSFRPQTLQTSEYRLHSLPLATVDKIVYSLFIYL